MFDHFINHYLLLLYYFFIITCINLDLRLMCFLIKFNWLIFYGF